MEDRGWVSRIAFETARPDGSRNMAVIVEKLPDVAAIILSDRWSRSGTGIGGGSRTTGRKTPVCC